MYIWYFGFGKNWCSPSFGHVSVLANHFKDGMEEWFVNESYWLIPGTWKE